MNLLLPLTLLSACVLHCSTAADSCCSDWGDWGPCYDCIQFRTRDCSGNGYQPCSYGEDYKESRECGKCPPPCDCKKCHYGSWGEWSQCTCSDPSPSRKRYMSCPECQHCRKEKSQRCAMAKWGGWSQWTKCDCHISTQTRKRTCNEVKGKCLCKDYHTANTEIKPCPKMPDSTWNPWTQWSDCPKCPKGYDPSYQPDYQPDYQPKYQPDYQPKYQPDYQPEYQPEYKPDYQPDYNPKYQIYKRDAPQYKVYKNRKRTCKMVCGKPCPGKDIEKEVCPKIPESEWSKWSKWSKCAKCPEGVYDYMSYKPGSITKKRTRKCSMHCGKKCFGSDVETAACPDPQMSTWGKWGKWSKCPKCADGYGPDYDTGYQPPVYKTRKRKCKVKCGMKCKGEGEEKGECPPPPKTYWSEWSDWTVCDKCPGYGYKPGSTMYKKRTRKCHAGCPGKKCHGDSEEKLPCPLPPKSYWENWSDWDTCPPCPPGGYSKMGGYKPYYKTRTRVCVKKCNKDCDGQNEEKMACPKPKDSYWDNWSDWSKCEICPPGYGYKDYSGGPTYKSRSRMCHMMCGKPCHGEKEEKLPCPLPPKSYWDNWSDWSTCAPCPPSYAYKDGYGWEPYYKTRTRMCNKKCMKDCDGESEQKMECPKPPGSYWDNWSDWSKCEICPPGYGYKGYSGGPTYKRRTRMCHMKCGKPCHGEKEEKYPCPLPPKSYWGDWTQWSKCEMCPKGYGYDPVYGYQPTYKTRSRMCISKCGKDDCKGEKEQKEKCPDPPKSYWGDWSAWGNCEMCPKGYAYNPTHGYQPTYKTRSRMCISKCGKDDCKGEKEEKHPCPAPPKPYWGDWSDWTKCEMCPKGYGYEPYGSQPMYKTRSRTCISKCGKDDCKGEKEEKAPCPAPPKPYWGDWSKWTICDMCPKGYEYDPYGYQPTYKTRSRMCHSKCGKDDCHGEKEQKEKCPIPPESKWSDWTSWSVCGKCPPGYAYDPVYGYKPYYKTRTRTCYMKCNKECKGEKEEKMECPKPPESQWGEWSAWPKCPCGGGLLKRKRVCHKECMKPCDGKDYEEKKCYNPYQPCVCKWSEWSACQNKNSYCNSCKCGVKERKYTCTKAHVCPERKCPRSTFEKRDCCDGYQPDYQPEYQPQPPY